jgi:DeoR/GlpR family transcriptional regulator of sugar metabolism
MFAQAGRLEQVHVLITDKKIDAEWAKTLAKHGVKVVKT